MKYNDCDCSSRNVPVRRHLEPVLVAKIYNQPIIEEMPYYATSMILDNTTTISNFEYRNNDGYNYRY